MREEIILERLEHADTCVMSYMQTVLAAKELEDKVTDIPEEKAQEILELMGGLVGDMSNSYLYSIIGLAEAILDRELPETEIEEMKASLDMLADYLYQNEKDAYDAEDIAHIKSFFADYM